MTALLAFLLGATAAFAAPEAPLDEGAIEAIQARGDFSADAGRALLSTLEHSKDAALRRKAARAFYLIFYDTREVRAQAAAFLLSAPTIRDVAALLRRSEDPEVSRHIAQFGQIMAQGYSAQDRERLAQAYVPIFIDALGHPSPEQRNELLVALENLKDTPALKSPASQAALKEALGRETDEGLREMLTSLLS